MLFSKNHIWVTVSGETARLGISDYAQSELGAIVFLKLPDIGDEIIIGGHFGDVESLKTVSDLISPIRGKVVSTNENLTDAPNAINSLPYDSWFIEVKITDISASLMDNSAYIEYLKTMSYN